MTRSARHLRAGDVPVIERPGGVKSLPILGPDDARELLAGNTLVPAGSVLGLHTHNCEECITVLEGHAICEADGVEYALAPFDIMFIPPEMEHGIRSVGDTDLRIQWVYGSIDATRRPAGGVEEAVFPKRSE